MALVSRAGWSIVDRCPARPATTSSASGTRAAGSAWSLGGQIGVAPAGDEYRALEARHDRSPIMPVEQGVVLPEKTFGPNRPRHVRDEWTVSIR